MAEVALRRNHHISLELVSRNFTFCNIFLGDLFTVLNTRFLQLGKFCYISQISPPPPKYHCFPISPPANGKNRFSGLQLVLPKEPSCTSGKGKVQHIEYSSVIYVKCEIIATVAFCIFWRMKEHLSRILKEL